MDRSFSSIRVKVSKYKNKLSLSFARFSTIIVSALLFIGTTLDLMLQRKKFCNDGCRKNFKYDNYTYAVNPPLQPYTDNEKAEADGCISGTKSPPFLLKIMNSVPLYLKLSGWTFLWFENFLNELGKLQ